MAIFGNFKGTTQSEFQIGKSTNGTKISTGTQPSSNLSTGDLWLNSANSTIEVYSSGEWKSIGSTLKELNVDSGTLFVDSSNDTVSIGSTSSNDKLFVNGSLRLGTNPSLKHSGAYLDVSHTNGSATQLRVRDNSSSGSDPIFKVYNANNVSEVFKVQGSTVTINNAYTLPSADGTNKQVMTSDGAGTVTFTSLNTLADTFVGGTDSYVQFNDDDNFHGVADFTYNKTTNTLTVPDVSITGNIVPTANVTYDLGTSSNRFKDLYLSGNTINLGTTSISINADNEVDFTDSANSSIKRKLVVDEIHLGDGDDAVVLKKGSDGRFQSKTHNRSTKGRSANKVDLDDNNSDDLSEGSTNLYFTNARANSAIDAKLTGDITLGNVTSQSVSSGVVSGVLFEPITDYGLIADSANMTIDYGAVTETATNGDFEYLLDTYGPTGDSYTVATVPSAAQPGQMIFISNETGGAVMAFSDGTNWRRITDRAVISA